MTENVYGFTAKALNGKDISLDSYAGKVILVVNTASKCGFTPQYEGLELLHKEFSSKGLVILGFPCNQFGKQEPGTEKDIAEGCLINYGVTFQMFSKIEVNGKNTHPLYQYLKSAVKNGIFGSAIKWNFTKFLVDKNGKAVKRFAPTTTPAQMRLEIEKLLNN